MKCAVKNCENENDSQACQISFFKFPSNPDVLQKWIDFCCRGEIFNPKTAVICMDHFRPEDMANKFEYEMGFSKRRLLKRTAVPTIKIDRAVHQRGEETVEFTSIELPSTSKKLYSANEFLNLKTELETLRVENEKLKTENIQLGLKLEAKTKKMEIQSKINKYEVDNLKRQLTKSSVELKNKLKNDIPGIAGSDDEPSTAFSWIDHLSEGGLVEPNAATMKCILELHKIFEAQNSNLFVGENYLQILLEQSKNIPCEERIKSLYFRARMYFKIRRLNQQIVEDSKSRKRKFNKTLPN